MELLHFKVKNYNISQKKKNSNFYRNNSNKLRFNSGWIGVSSRTNFLDFLYLSCTFNPTFVRMV